MQNYQIIFRSIFASVLGCSTGLAAADTQNLNVTARVESICKFTPGTPILTFGPIDPSSTTPISGSGAVVSYKCTKGTVAAGVTLDNGLSPVAGIRNLKSGTDVIPYSLSLTGDRATGAGFGSGVTASSLTFTSSIAVAAFENAPAGTYTDTVVMTLTP